jgi:hypothetical protein
MNHYLLHTTYPVVFLSVFARRLCLPVPAILFLLSGGALAGTGHLSFCGIQLVAVCGCLLGDLVWFEAERLHGKRVLRLPCALALDQSCCIRRARTAFAKRGLRILLIAQFIPVTRMLAEKEDPTVIQSWLTGLNPELGDRVPLRLMRENDLETVAPEIMGAARAFIVGG